MSDLGFNIWGVVAGVIGTVALVPVFLAWLRTRVPTKRFPALRDLLKETQDLFKTVVQEGLITDEDELREIDCNMAL